jgi:hypothetical protein
MDIAPFVRCGFVVASFAAANEKVKIKAVAFNGVKNC